MVPAPHQLFTRPLRPSNESCSQEQAGRVGQLIWADGSMVVSFFHFIRTNLTVPFKGAH